MISTFQQLVTYWRDTADAHVAIKTFALGGYERIQSHERADMEYPLLWLELPSVQPHYDESNGSKCVFSSAFLVLQNTEVNDFEAQEIALHDTLEIVYDILGKIKNEWDLNDMTIDPSSIVIDSKGPIGGDYSVGWRVEFATADYRQFCYDQTKFGL